MCNCGKKKRTTWTYRQARENVRGQLDTTTDNTSNARKTANSSNRSKSRWAAVNANDTVKSR